MNKIILGLLLFTILPLRAQEMESPDGRFKMSFQIENGTPIYQLDYKNKPVIKPSRLGLEADGICLSNGFTVTDTKTSTHDETWKPVWGQYSSIRNQYNELAVSMNQKDSKNRQMVVRFRLFNDGLAFRYEFPAQPELRYFTVKEEITEFSLTGNHKTFCIEGDYDTNEFPYTTAPLSGVREKVVPASLKKGYEAKATSFCIQTPLMMKSADGLYINIHEASLVDYSAMLLNVDEKNFKLSAHLTPDKLGKKGYLQAPCQSPWRKEIKFTVIW